MLSEYQLKIADLCNIPIGNVKILVPNLWFASLWKLRVKLKQIHRVLESHQSQLWKPYIEFNRQKRIEAEKNNGNNGKALC